MCNALSITYNIKRATLEDKQMKRNTSVQHGKVGWVGCTCVYYYDVSPSGPWSVACPLLAQGGSRLLYSRVGMNI